VLHNREASALQYAMWDRLTALGWSEIEVIDDDLGRSAASLCIEGFRAWVTDDRARLEKCNCDFGGCENAEVNPHYRIKRALLARPRAP